MQAAERQDASNADAESAVRPTGLRVRACGHCGVNDIPILTPLRCGFWCLQDLVPESKQEAASQADGETAGSLPPPAISEMVDEFSGSALALAPRGKYDLLKQSFINAWTTQNGANARTLRPARVRAVRTAPTAPRKPCNLHSC